MESDHRGSAPPGRQGGANKAEGTAPAAGAGGCGETAGVLLAFREVGAIVSGKSVVHIKGFGGGMPDVYHSDALAQIQGFDVVVWDGDPLKAGAFTELVPLYLATNSGGLGEWRPRTPCRAEGCAGDAPQEHRSSSGSALSQGGVRRPRSPCLQAQPIGERLPGQVERYVAWWRVSVTGPVHAPPL